MKYFVSCGGDASNVDELLAAILSQGGLNNVKCAIIEVKKGDSKMQHQTTIKDVSTIHSASFDRCGKMKVWQFYGVGIGRTIKLSADFRFISNSSLKGPYEGSKTKDIPQNPIRNNNPQCSTSKEPENNFDIENESTSHDTSWDELRRYIVNEVAMDTLQDNEVLVLTKKAHELKSFNKIYSIGCAIQKRKYGRIKPNQKKFVQLMVEKSIKENKKLAPQEVIQAMRSSGEFTTSEYLKDGQVKSLMQRILAEAKSGKTNKTKNAKENISRSSNKICTSRTMSRTSKKAASSDEEISSEETDSSDNEGSSDEDEDEELILQQIMNTPNIDEDIV